MSTEDGLAELKQNQLEGQKCSIKDLVEQQNCNQGNQNDCIMVDESLVADAPLLAPLVGFLLVSALAAALAIL